MPRLRRSTSASRDPVRQIEEGRKLERSRSANLNNRPCRRSLRRYWKALVVGCGCLTVVLLSVPRGAPVNDDPKASKQIRRFFTPQVSTCPPNDEWLQLPKGIKMDVHVVARGNTENLRTTLRSLTSACYPEDATLELYVWALPEHARDVLSAQDGFVWTRGNFHPRMLTTEENVPPLEGWARMWTDPLDDEVRLVLPEGLEVSRLFYFWLTGTLRKYMGEETSVEELSIFRENVFGISLSATGLCEVSGRPMSWEAYEVADGKLPIFHTLPGSRGTAFFGWQWRGFKNFMDARARVLDADSWEGEPLLHASAVQSWAGSLERFLGEYSHGRGLGVLHPNLDGAMSFARQSSTRASEPRQSSTEHDPHGREAHRREDITQAVASEGAGTPQPTITGTVETERATERLVTSHKDVSMVMDKYSPVSAVPAYDVMFRRHPDLSHLRLLAYRFIQRLQTAQNRNVELEACWRRPESEQPVYSEVKYLIYQPQFGMGNQLRALESGLAVARVLGRMLVVPDYIADNGEGMPVRYDAIWEFGFLEELVGRHNVILQADFDALLRQKEVVDPPKQLYLAAMPIKQLTGNDDYFDRMGWGELPQVPLPLANATEAGWRELQEAEDQVLAVTAMFGMFQGWTQDSLIGDQYWHDMVKLHVSEEATWLHDLVDDSITRFTEKAKIAGGESLDQAEAEESEGEGEVASDRRVSGSETQFMCAHVRRQDFQASCVRYEEEYRSASSRPWVTGALANGGLCWVEETDFRKTVDIFLQQAPTQLGVKPHFVFSTSDDQRFLEATKYGNSVPVFTLTDLPLPQDLKVLISRDGSDMNAENHASAESGRVKCITPEEVRAALPAIDVAVCSRAALLLLNSFSTYSALIKAKAKAQPNFVRGLYWAEPPPCGTGGRAFLPGSMGFLGSRNKA